MDPVTIAAAAFGVAGAVTVVRLSLKHISKGIQLLDQSEVFSDRDGASESKARFRLVVQRGPENPDVDVVFIHGLSGHQWTWNSQAPGSDEHDYSRTNELQAEDFDLGNAKVMHYYYDISLRSSEFLLTRTLCHENKQLLNCLALQRTEEVDSSRPIIFVAHSLGGILLKNALASSKLSGKAAERAICESTGGIIFLDTPYRGSVTSIAHSVWNIVKPILSQEQLERETWEAGEFLSAARSIGYNSDRFEPIASSLPVVPVYIDTVGLGGSTYSISETNAVHEALKEIRSRLRKTCGRSDQTTSTSEADISALQDLDDFTVGTNWSAVYDFMPNDERPAKGTVTPYGQTTEDRTVEMTKCLFTETSSIAVLHNDSRWTGTNLALTFARTCWSEGPRNPYESIFLIKARNHTSISMSFLHIYRKILNYHTERLGRHPAHRLLGVEEVDNMSDDDILANPEVLKSTIEAVYHWLARPKNNRWLLIIDNMQLNEEDLIDFVPRSNESKRATLELFLRSKALLRSSSGSRCHIIYTTSQGSGIPSYHIIDADAAYSHLEAWMTPRRSSIEYASAPLRSHYHNRGGLDKVCERILGLCIILSDNDSRGVSSKVLELCNNILINTDEACEFHPSIEQALGHLSGKNKIVLSPEPHDVFCRVAKTTRIRWGKSGRRKRHALIDTAWSCLATSTWSIKKDGSNPEHWELGASIADSCSAVVGWYGGVQGRDDIQHLPHSLYADLRQIAELCETHSKHQTALWLYEREYEHLGDGQPGPMAEVAFRLARTYFKLGMIDRAQENCDTAIKLIDPQLPINNQLVISTHRLQTLMYVEKGDFQRATAKLEDLLSKFGNTNQETHVDTAGTEEVKSHTALISVIRDLSDSLACQGEYENVVALLQRAFLAQTQLKWRSQPTTMVLLDSMAALHRRQGDLRQAEVCYIDAQRLTKDWLGSSHHVSALQQTKRGVVVGLQGRRQEAADLFREALKTVSRCLGAGHGYTLDVHENLIYCLAADGDYDGAINEVDKIEEKSRKEQTYLDEDAMRRLEQYRKALSEARTNYGGKSKFTGVLSWRLKWMKNDFEGVDWFPLLETQIERGSSQAGVLFKTKS